MRRIQVSGKPSYFNRGEAEGGQEGGGAFVLTESYWTQGQVHEIKWLVHVPSHKMKYAEKMTEKGYTLICAASEFEIHASPDFQGGVHGWMVLSDLIVP